MMIKEQELRIGNWVSYGGMYGYITVFNNNKVVIKCNKSIHKCYVHDLYPIPLTEQWLIDFGFAGRLGEVSDVFHIGINPVTHDWLFDIVWIHGTEYPFYKNGHFIIKYVHQLQTLYFAITGEELVIDKMKIQNG